MRFRFSLKKLLVAVTLFAILAGYYGNRIVALNEEREALVELDEYWAVTVNREGAQADESWLKQTLDWPIRKILGPAPKMDLPYRSTDRAVVLELYASSRDAHGEPRSLKGIEKFTKLQRLRLYRYSAITSRIVIRDEELRRIAGLRNLRKLEIPSSTITANGILHLKDLQLTELSAGSQDWDVAEFQAISKIQSLEQLHLSSRVCVLEPLAELPKLKNLSIYADQLTDLTSLSRFPALETLYIHGQFSAEQISNLSGAKELKKLKLISWGMEDSEDSIVETIIQIPKLEQVEFGWNSISKKSFDQLVDHGLDVNHQGLTDFKSAGKQLRFDTIYAEIDTEKSKLTATIEYGKPGVGWRIQVRTTDKYYPTMKPLPWFDSPTITTAGGWDGLASRGFVTVLDRNAVHFFDGEEHPTFDNVLDVYWRKGNVVRLRWHFASGISEGHGTVDGEFFLKSIIVKSKTPISLQQATADVKKYFAIEEFAPSQDTGLKKMHEFVFKSQ